MLLGQVRFLSLTTMLSVNLPDEYRQFSSSFAWAGLQFPHWLTWFANITDRSLTTAENAASTLESSQLAQSRFRLAERSACSIGGSPARKGGGLLCRLPQ